MAHVLLSVIKTKDLLLNCWFHLVQTKPWLVFCLKNGVTHQNIDTVQIYVAQKHYPY